MQPIVTASMGERKLRKVLVGILMLIVVGFSYIGYTSLDHPDARPSAPQEVKNY
ncbi:hypothetical protein QRD89_04370 [Halobacillus sp. ACCC02827]|uniref:hypothetical protein n=1 Tax=Bacillaceae TaxID=186817 RepID=UPI000319829E|nr:MULTISPECIES: hypothetical protein [Bacillaceae]QHT45800.1 hypothetical protein M662_04500 [Bacillus sp. SB49]WJE16601.1 hypothetical protein QRD89_04370 [Halobacillus sp. ACCC02827]